MPCARSPNCVSSRATDPRHRVPPLTLAVDGRDGWAALVEVVRALPRTRIVDEGDAYLRTEVRSLVFRVVDDLECWLEGREGHIDVRSASRVGYWDLGVNRRRVDRIRRQLRRRGVVR